MYPWNVDKLHINTQYLLVELSREELVYEALKYRNVQKGQRGI